MSGHAGFTFNIDAIRKLIFRFEWNPAAGCTLCVSHEQKRKDEWDKRKKSGKNSTCMIVYISLTDMTAIFMSLYKYKAIKLELREEKYITAS